MADRLAAGRLAFDRHEWSEVYAAFSALRDRLEPADLERLAIAAYLIGDDDGNIAALELAHRGHLEAGSPSEAARCAFWLALCLLLRGDSAQGGGWLARAARLVDESGEECAAQGYLLVAEFLQTIDDGDAAAAEALALRALDIGVRCGDADLVALGLLSHGEALVAAGAPAQGMTRLDEVMVSVAAGEVGPVTTGIVYCAVVLECMKVFDYARAGEWTRALGTWCDSQPDLVPYRGQCLIHRSQLEQVSGDWPDAAETVERACKYLTDPPHPAVGLAHYQAAELYRLVGRFDDAQAAYGEAHRHGHQPIPGLALLEVARGDRDAAAATIRRARRETVATQQAPALLAAAAEIFAATGDLAEARAAAEELRALAAGASSQVLDALAAQVTGTVALAEGDADAALGDLRAAATAWQQLRMPYEGARTAVVLGRACAALGDRATAALEYDRARCVFAELGAAPDLARVPAAGDATAARPPESARPLSEREREVLAEVAAGRTNRQIAEVLTISEHTVGRHLENIFAKLGVTSRAAATAAAYERDLL